MKFVTTVLTGACLALSLSAADAASVNLRFAYASNATPTKEAMAKFGELVTKKTNGEVTVSYFPDSQLGGERELVEMVQGGLLDMTKVSGGLLESFAPVYGVFSMPYLFDSQAHFYRVMDDQKIMGPIYQSTAARGMVGITYYDSGARSFYTAKKPIEKVADLKGLKIRVLQSPTLIRMVQLLGAAPIAMSQDEVYTLAAAGCARRRREQRVRADSRPSRRGRQVLHPRRPHPHPGRGADLQGDARQAEPGAARRRHGRR